MKRCVLLTLIIERDQTPWPPLSSAISSAFEACASAWCPPATRASMCTCNSSFLFFTGPHQTSFSSWAGRPAHCNCGRIMYCSRGANARIDLFLDANALRRPFMRTTSDSGPQHIHRHAPHPRYSYLPTLSHRPNPCMNPKIVPLNSTPDVSQRAPLRHAPITWHTTTSMFVSLATLSCNTNSACRRKPPRGLKCIDTLFMCLFLEGEGTEWAGGWGGTDWRWAACSCHNIRPRCCAFVQYDI